MRLVYLMLLMLSFTSCKKNEENNTPVFPILLKFSNSVGNQALQLNTAYTNAFGESFTPKTFRYYITNISVKNNSGQTEILPATYFLVSEDSAASKTIQLQVQSNNITSVQFLLGVDSTRNVSGTQTGALDPVLGMFWTWNTGYITAKLEGNSPVSTIPQNAFQYHIGGFKTGENTTRNIQLSLANAAQPKTGQPAIIYIQADVLKWFSGVHQLKIADNAFVHSPGALAVKYADNFANMFSIQNVINP